MSLHETFTECSRVKLEIHLYTPIKYFNIIRIPRMQKKQPEAPNILFHSPDSKLLTC